MPRRALWSRLGSEVGSGRTFIVGALAKEGWRVKAKSCLSNRADAVKDRYGDLTDFYRKKGAITCVLANRQANSLFAMPNI